MRWPRGLLAMLCAGLLAAAPTGCGYSAQWEQADLDRNRLTIAMFHGNESAGDLAGELDQGTRLISATGALDHYTSGGDMRIVIAYPDGTFMAREYDTYDCYEFTSPSGHDIDFSETDCPDGLPDPQDEWGWVREY